MAKLTVDEIFGTATTGQLMDLIARRAKELKIDGVSRHKDNKWLLIAGPTPVMMVAHCDTVHTKKGPIVVHDKGYVWSPDGIGGDDRAGVWGLLEMLEEGIDCCYLFTDEEETGCIGAKAAAEDILPGDVEFLIELDRRGRNDAVFYSCGNKKFQEFILNPKYGFKKDTGSCSDISKLMPAWNLAGVNFSVGYYNPHSVNEYVSLAEARRTVDAVIQIIADRPGVTFEYEEEKFTYSTVGYGFSGVSVTHGIRKIPPPPSKYCDLYFNVEKMSWEEFPEEPESIPDFTCPKCNGKYFGTNTSDNTIFCRSANETCGWRGKWSDLQEETEHDIEIIQFSKDGGIVCDACMRECKCEHDNSAMHDYMSTYERLNDQAEALSFVQAKVGQEFFCHMCGRSCDCLGGCSIEPQSADLYPERELLAEMGGEG